MTLHAGQLATNQRQFTCERCGKSLNLPRSTPLPRCPECDNDTWVDEKNIVPTEEELRAALQEN